jgi:hypothetical protein
MNQERDRPKAVFMSAMPKLIYAGGRLANTTTMDYCSQVPDKQKPVHFGEEGRLCGAPSILTTGHSCGKQR